MTSADHLHAAEELPGELKVRLALAASQIRDGTAATALALLEADVAHAERKLRSIPRFTTGKQ